MFSRLLCTNGSILLCFQLRTARRGSSPTESEMLTSSTSLSSSASVGRDQKSTSQVVSSMECFFLGSEWGWHLIVVGEGGLKVVSLWSCFASL